MQDERILRANIYQEHTSSGYTAELMAELVVCCCRAITQDFGSRLLAPPFRESCVPDRLGENVLSLASSPMPKAKKGCPACRGRHRAHTCGGGKGKAGEAPSQDTPQPNAHAAQIGPTDPPIAEPIAAAITQSFQTNQPNAFHKLMATAAVKWQRTNADSPDVVAPASPPTPSTEPVCADFVPAPDIAAAAAVTTDDAADAAPGVPASDAPRVVFTGYGVAPKTLPLTFDRMTVDQRGRIEKNRQDALFKQSGKKQDLPGIVEGHFTYNSGKHYQIYIHNLHRYPLCKPTCPGYKSRAKCAATCEHGILLQAQKAAGIDLRR